ncbi:MAG: UDP-3-O-[3-hydroxymyristoyl] N-acetylglucosamine deacetylase [Deltaproteobacteria bacterium]|nr:UDP-3-O-[3-hydroxymyristoyl] N-acetylglucosamine deacetylase [Deltaproteobacteria bacterium]
MKRKTILRPLHIKGLSLHKGEYVELNIRPSEEGIVFIREGTRIPARPENVVDTRLSTTLGKGKVCISTVEHLMSALYGLGITDCEIEIKGEELPSMDGSALPFIKQLQQVGIKYLGQDISPIPIKSPIIAGDSNSSVEIHPGLFSLSYKIAFEEPAIGSQEYVFEGNNYIEEIAPARTFGRLCDVEMMRAQGLAIGGGLHNAVLVDREDILNPEGLRFKDEFVRHKVLDILGDLWLLGSPVEGEIRAVKANHRLHIELILKIKEIFCGI